MVEWVRAQLVVTQRTRRGGAWFATVGFGSGSSGAAGGRRCAAGRPILACTAADGGLPSPVEWGPRMCRGEVQDARAVWAAAHVCREREAWRHDVSSEHALMHAEFVRKSSHFPVNKSEFDRKAFCTRSVTMFRKKKDRAQSRACVCWVQGRVVD